MTVIQGGGGGIADCWISPSDMAGQIDNLISRVEKLEQILSLLTGMDVTAAQLADITQSAGVLTDLIAVASNAAGGWITDGTFTGVAISTLGWTMSDGNLFPIVTMQDGVLQYGFGLDGSVSGAAVTGGNRFAYLKTQSPIIALAAAPDIETGTFTISKNDTALVSLLGPTGFQVSTSGFYLVSLAAPVSTNNGGNGYASVSCGFSPQGSGALSIDGNRNTGPRVVVPITGSFPAASQTYTDTRFMYIDSGASGTLSAVTQGSGVNIGIGQATISLALLRAEQL